MYTSPNREKSIPYDGKRIILGQVNLSYEISSKKKELYEMESQKMSKTKCKKASFKNNLLHDQHLLKKNPYSMYKPRGLSIKEILRLPLRGLVCCCFLWGGGGGLSLGETGKHCMLNTFVSFCIIN